MDSRNVVLTTLLGNHDANALHIHTDETGEPVKDPNDTVVRPKELNEETKRSENRRRKPTVDALYESWIFPIITSGPVEGTKGGSTLEVEKEKGTTSTDREVKRSTCSANENSDHEKTWLN